MGGLSNFNFASTSACWAFVSAIWVSRVVILDLRSDLGGYELGIWIVKKEDGELADGFWLIGEIGGE